MSTLAMAARKQTPESPSRGPSYHHGDLEAALKAATVQLIAERGVDGFSMREAAVAVGVSPSAAYRHFADKAELLAAVSRDAFSELGQRFEASMARAQAKAGPGAQAVALARFAAQGRAYVQFALDHPARFQVMFGPFGAGRAGGLWRPGEEKLGTLHILSGALDALLSCGAISAAARADAEVPVWSAIHGLACLLVAKVVKGSSGPRAQVLIDQVLQHLLNALNASPRSSPNLTPR